jgi:hypothetical protein
MPAGASMVPVALIRYGKEQLAAAIPNATAWFPNLSLTFHAEAKSLLKKCISEKGEFGELPNDEVFTFYERMDSRIIPNPKPLTYIDSYTVSIVLFCALPFASFPAQVVQARG